RSGRRTSRRHGSATYRARGVTVVAEPGGIQADGRRAEPIRRRTRGIAHRRRARAPIWRERAQRRLESSRSRRVMIRCRAGRTAVLAVLTVSMLMRAAFAAAQL